MFRKKASKYTTYFNRYTKSLAHNNTSIIISTVYFLLILGSKTCLHWFESHIGNFSHILLYVSGVKYICRIVLSVSHEMFSWITSIPFSLFGYKQSFVCLRYLGVLPSFNAVLLSDSITRLDSYLSTLNPAGLFHRKYSIFCFSSAT